VDLLFHFKKREERWRPFVAAGSEESISLRVRNRSAADSADRPADDERCVEGGFSVGGGVKFHPMPHVILLAEFRDYLTTFPSQEIVPAPHNTAGGVFQQFTPLFGVSYTF
jgi:hypothetical protein